MVIRYAIQVLFDLLLDPVNVNILFSHTVFTYNIIGKYVHSNGDVSFGFVMAAMCPQCTLFLEHSSDLTTCQYLTKIWTQKDILEGIL